MGGGYGVRRSYDIYNGEIFSVFGWCPFYAFELSIAFLDGLEIGWVGR